MSTRHTATGTLEAAIVFAILAVLLAWLLA